MKKLAVFINRANWGVRNMERGVDQQLEKKLHMQSEPLIEQLERCKQLLNDTQRKKIEKQSL